MRIYDATNDVQCQDSGSIFTNCGATGTITKRLPPAKKGLEYSFANKAAYIFSFTVFSSSDKIKIGSAITCLTLTSNSIEDHIHVVCEEDGYWSVDRSPIGEWSPS